MAKDTLGRDIPPKFFTEENRNLIYRALETGATVKDCADMVGCSTQTIYAWLQRGDKTENPDRDAEYVTFAKKFRACTAKKKLFHLQNIVNAAKSGNWQASAWYLERAFPQEYARTTRKPEDDSSVEQIKAIRELIAEVKKDAEK